MFRLNLSYNQSTAFGRMLKITYFCDVMNGGILT